MESESVVQQNITEAPIQDVVQKTPEQTLTEAEKDVQNQKVEESQSEQTQEQVPSIQVTHTDASVTDILQSTTPILSCKFSIDTKEKIRSFFTLFFDQKDPQPIQLVEKMKVLQDHIHQINMSTDGEFTTLFPDITLNEFEKRICETIDVAFQKGWENAFNYLLKFFEDNKYGNISTLKSDLELVEMELDNMEEDLSDEEDEDDEEEEESDEESMTD